ncbi:GNAT family N-acetyltransferase [Desulfoluna sp.]|uniref:GNAT family N-acetyltransferase n=1 Tax=Desulfoluna sp. TaxID=2045199 RepID=UPI0026176C54|nr:GNAT family N-acetyltransferase [Desulfoluna sp.]
MMDTESGKTYADLPHFPASSRAKSSLSLPARIDYLEPIQNYVEGLCHVHGCETQESLMVVLAVEEAVSNVIQHGFASEKGGTFDISFDVGAADLTIEIHDKGLPFDPRMLSACGESDASEVSDPHEGLGVRLMKGAMDRVEFINLGKQGKLVRMFKYFRHGKVAPDLSGDQHPTEATPNEPPLVPPFSVRPLTEAEALDVSRCAYRAYGYTYRDFIYYPQKIWELNQDGQLHSFVLVDAQNKLLGHLALSFSAPEATIAELTAAFVDPACRGKRLLGQLMVEVMSKAEMMGIRNLFVHAVTSHHASQKSATLFDFIPTGLLLAALFPDLEFKALTGKVSQKENALLMVKPLKARSPYTLYVPNRYTEIIRSLSTNVGQMVSVEDTSPPLPDLSGGEGNRYYQVEEFNFAEIRIRTFGEDVLEELGQRVKGYVRNRIDVIYLYLDIECPEAAPFAARCLELGFFFCGYMPGEMAGRDGLILQKLNDISIDFTALDLDGDQAREVMEFIQGDMAAREEK